MLLFIFSLTSFCGASLLYSRAQSASVTGISDWKQTTNYGATSSSSSSNGVALTLQSCVTWSGYVYCVGGFGASTPSSLTSAVYYAPLNPDGGFGPWMETTDYGAASGSSGAGGVLINRESCVASSGYIYCVGGQSATGSNYTNFLSQVYFAPLSSSGVGAWVETTDYGASSGTSGSSGVPVWTKCVTFSGYIYCVGGFASSGETSATYFAKLTSSGVGPWSETTDYGAPAGSSSGSSGVKVEFNSCTVDNDSYIYCVGGSINVGGSQSFYSSNVYYAPLSTSGIGSWTETTDYGAASGSTGSGGVKLFATACTDYPGYIFCVGGKNTTGLTAAVYFAPVSPSGVGAWTRTKSLGDQEVDDYNENDFVYISDCATYLEEILGGTAGDWFAWLLGLPNTCTTTTPASTSTSSESTTSTTTIVQSVTSTTSTKANPILYTVLNPRTTISPGGQAYDSAGFVGGSLALPASGNVTYYRYSGPNCTGTKSELGTVFVGSDGTVPNSPFTTFPNAGTYDYSASYTGDARNNPDNSACEVLTVGSGSTASFSSTAASTTLSSSSSTVTESSTSTSTTTTPLAPSSSSGDDGIENLFLWNEKYSGFLVYGPFYIYAVVVVGLGAFVIYRKRGPDEDDDDNGSPGWEKVQKDLQAPDFGRPLGSLQETPPPPPPPPPPQNQSNVPTETTKNETGDALGNILFFVSGDWSKLDPSPGIMTVSMHVSGLNDTIGDNLNPQLPGVETSPPSTAVGPTDQVM